MCDYEKIRSIIKEELDSQYRLIDNVFVTQETFDRFKIVVIVAIATLGGSGLLKLIL